MLIEFLCLLLPAQLPTPPSDEESRVPPILQPLEPLVGEWRVHGFLESDRIKGWDEPTTWGWRFEKGKIVALEATFKGGKYFKSATLGPSEHKGQYRFVATGADGASGTYEGELKGKKLTLVRQGDGPVPDQVTLELLHDVRYQMLIEARKTPGSVKKIATIGATRAEVRFGAAGKEEQGPKCIITGAPGTSSVTYMGTNYFVCCSGCRAEFEHDPEKWLRLAKEAKLKKDAAAKGDTPPASESDSAKTPNPKKEENKPAPSKDIAKQKNDADAKSAANLLSRATLLEKNGKTDAAIQVYERLVKEFPKSPETKEAETRLAELRK
jgi:YHS domain-containing protein